jgi:hypothetical protein
MKTLALMVVCICIGTASLCTSDALAQSVIESQIDGDFEGWDGETVVKLMNGQIWIQTEYYYEYHYAFMPNVLVYRTPLGWKMRVDGIRKSVGVEQLR